ncbi:MAG TPA: erythromycin esterase family protein, partial [Thermomicrobiales bacterium]|nr:erythromycin esterase family protein [Thermomicrobiales bacterium]
MKATRDRRDVGAGSPEQRVTRRDLVARALALGCSAATAAGLLAACQRAGPAASGALATGAVAPTTPRPGTGAPVAGSPAASAPATPATAAARGTPPPLPAAGIAWLRDHAIPFATAEPGGDYTDLLPLKPLLGGARLVALGEATQGTHEFSAMKQRLLAFLVQELGFTTFAVEANWPEARRVDACVRAGQGDPTGLLAGLHSWPVDTREMLDLLRWMRAHNARPAPAPPVGFAGLDMQLPNLAIDDVLAYVQGVDAPAAARYTALYAPFRPYALQQLGFGRTTYGEAPPSIKAQCRAGVRQAHDGLEGRRDAYSAAASPRAFARALQGARVVEQAEAMWAYGPAPEAEAVRDRAMAE